MGLILLLLLLLKLTLSTADSTRPAALIRALRSLPPNKTNSDVCATSPEWQNTPLAWEDSNADSELRNLLTSITADGSERFDRALGSRYGAHSSAFECGIDMYSTCPLPACSDYEDDPDETWAYLATVSTVHLATKFNILYTAVTNGQLDFEGITDDLADNFFHWKDPIFVGHDISFWVVAIITVAMSALASGVDPEAAVVLAGVGTFLSAATQEVSLSMTPPSGLTRNVGVSYLQKTSSQIGQSSRNALEAWANSTFAGVADRQGNTIVDYFHAGAFLYDGAIPSAADTEKFYKTSMIAKTINWQWSTKANFLMFASTGDVDDAYGPQASRVYSQSKKGVYNLYNLDSKKLQAPSGLQLLNGSVYGSILPWQITKSAAKAWEYVGNNYTSEVAMSRIQESFSSNNSLNPFADGAAWEGMFTLPVCDVGQHTEWLTDYGGSGLPCCCGVDCQDTKEFVRAANLNKSATLYNGCKKLLKNTMLNFDNIDYGIDVRSSFKQKWEDEWTRGQKGGIGFGLVCAGLIAICIIIGAIGCCS